MGIVNNIESSNPGESVQLFSLIFHMWLDGWCCGSLVLQRDDCDDVFLLKRNLKAACDQSVFTELPAASRWPKNGADRCGDNM